MGCADVIGINFPFKLGHLRMKDGQKVGNPRIPIGQIAVETSLCAPQCKIVAFLSEFNRCFEGNIRDEVITTTHEKQRCKRPRQTTIAIMEWVNGQKRHNENCNNNEWMNRSFI